MRLQGNGPKVARERLAIDICLPSLGHIQFVGIAQGCELRLPDVEEIPQGEGTNLWGLYMDHAIAGMRVQPAQAGTIRCNPDPLGNSDGLPIKGEGQMGMDVKDGLFHLITAMPSIGLCCKKVDTLVNSASIREQKRSFLHEEPESVQMASFRSRDHSAVCPVVPALLSQLP